MFDNSMPPLTNFRVHFENFHDTTLFLRFLVTFEQGADGIFDRLKKYFQTKKLERKTFWFTFFITRFFHFSILLVLTDLVGNGYLCKDGNFIGFITFRLPATYFAFCSSFKWWEYHNMNVFAQRNRLLSLLWFLRKVFGRKLTFSKHFN